MSTAEFVIPRISGCGFRPVERMYRAEYGRLLNALLGAERACARLLGAYLDELPPGAGEAGALSAIRGEAMRNCAILTELLLEAGVAPTMALAASCREGLAVQGARERLQFLSRVEGWSVRTIAEALPYLAQLSARRHLKQMYAGHRANVELCRRLAL
jgi:hypothetical protein